MRRGCRLRTRLQWSLVSWTRGAGQQRDALAQRCGERSACPRGAEARQVPRADPPRSTLRGSTPPGAPCPMARISGCETGPDPQPKSRRAVGSRGPERARSGGDHLAQQVLAGCGAVGAPSGGNLTFAPRQRSKTSPKSLRRLGAAAAPRRRVKRAGLAPAWGGADVPKALRGDFHSLVATTAAASQAGGRTLFTEPKIGLLQKVVSDDFPNRLGRSILGPSGFPDLWHFRSS